MPAAGSAGARSGGAPSQVLSIWSQVSGLKYLLSASGLKYLLSVSVLSICSQVPGTWPAPRFACGWTTCPSPGAEGSGYFGPRLMRAPLVPVPSSCPLLLSPPAPSESAPASEIRSSSRRGQGESGSHGHLAEQGRTDRHGPPHVLNPASLVLQINCSVLRGPGPALHVYRRRTTPF